MNSITLTTETSVPNKYCIGDMFMVDGELSILAELDDFCQVISLKDGVAWEASRILLEDENFNPRYDGIPIENFEEFELDHGVRYIGPCDFSVTPNNTRK